MGSGPCYKSQDHVNFKSIIAFLKVNRMGKGYIHKPIHLE